MARKIRFDAFVSTARPVISPAAASAGAAAAGEASGPGTATAPRAIRADTLAPQGEGTRLRYVNCPQAPFNGSTEQNVCAGL